MKFFTKRHIKARKYALYSGVNVKNQVTLVFTENTTGFSEARRKRKERGDETEKTEKKNGRVWLEIKMTGFLKI